MEFISVIGSFFADKIYSKAKNQKMGNYLFLFFTLSLLVGLAYFFNAYILDSLQVSCYFL